ncbi:hypothetical protein NM962_21205 [Mycobacterium sp. SVM_VP21]|nr:hypothetical protein NM962_21205 [Mycobacterium sp. SVM_VP21]
MTKVPVLRFHTKYGPAPLFDNAREQLKGLSGLNLEIPHAKARFDEREIPRHHLTDFQPECWEVVTVETAKRTGRVTYMSLRRRLESKKYLWIVLAFEHVITAWVTESPSNRATNPLIVKDGPAWDAAAEGRTGSFSGWANANAHRDRAQRVLAAVATLPERPSGERLVHAAQRVLAGDGWNEAAAEAGWASRKCMEAAIARLLRAAKQSGLQQLMDDLPAAP